MINQVTKTNQQNTQLITKEYYLIGGGEYDDNVKKKIETKILRRVNTPTILIIPWTSKDPNELKKYHKILYGFFKRLKAKRILFLEESDSFKKIKKKFVRANIIYLPGGETEILLKKITQKKITNLLRKFKGIIVGVSAGAYVLTKGYVQFQNNKTLIVPALKLVDVFIKAHYTPKMNNHLIHFSKQHSIYGIADNSALVFREKKINGTIGKVYLFNKGEKVIKTVH